MRQLYAFRMPFNTKKDGEGYRPPKINQDRDGWAMHLLIDTQREPCDLIIPGLNTDASDLTEKSVRSRLLTGDVVLTSTRLGIDDVSDKVKTPVLPGCNWLEATVIELWHRYISHCSRKRVELTEAGVEALPQRHQARLGNLEFSDTDDALISDRRLKTRRTVAYIIHGESLWTGGPRCLSIFGMSGTVTLGFLSVLAERWSAELRQLTRSEIIVAEIVRTGLSLIPASVQGFPNYWRYWDVVIYRSGTETLLPQDM